VAEHDRFIKAGKIAHVKTELASHCHLLDDPPDQ
jgi:hypothetical protein